MNLGIQLTDYDELLQACDSLLTPEQLAAGWQAHVSTTAYFLAVYAENKHLNCVTALRHYNMDHLLSDKSVSLVKERLQGDLAFAEKAS